MDDRSDYQQAQEEDTAMMQCSIAAIQSAIDHGVPAVHIAWMAREMGIDMKYLDIKETKDEIRKG